MADLLHLSDPHFGTERDVVGDALLRLHHDLSPAVVVVSGDITQRATASQFTSAARFVRALHGAKVLVLPGNHDIPLYDLVSRLTAPYARYSRCFGPELEPVLDTPALLVIAVNTVRPYRHKDGELSTGQIERVAARLRRATPQQLRVVVAHHPLAVTRPEDERNRAHRSSRAIRAWTAAGVDLMLGGHIHLPFLLPLAPDDPALERQAWQVQAGTAISARVRGTAPNSVNLIRHLSPVHDARRACTVQRWDFDEVRQRFTLANDSTLQLFRAAATPVSDPPSGRRTTAAPVAEARRGAIVSRRILNAFT